MRGSNILISALSVTHFRRDAKDKGWVNTTSTEPLPPQQDVFYNWTGEPLANFHQGDVLKWRQVGLSNYTGVDRAFQLLYRTESALGDPEAAVTTVIVPENNNNKTVISYQYYEDAASIDCAPSYGLVTQSAYSDVQTLLNEGHVVVSADYEGFNSTFTAGIHEGKLTLDSIRAYLNIRTNVTQVENSDTAIVGYSGGSIASGWAAELQPSYAPELNIAGIAVGGFVTNLTATVLSVNKGPYVGFVPVGILGLASAYPELWDLLNEELLPQNRTIFLSALKYCTEADLMNYLGIDVFSFFKDGDQIWYKSPLNEILDNNTLGVHHVPKIPYLIYEGARDVIAVPGEAFRAAEFYCDNGVPVRYVNFTDLDHFGAGGMFALVEQFLTDIFSGNAPKQCSITSGTSEQILASLNATSSNSTSSNSSSSGSLSTASFSNSTSTTSPSGNSSVSATATMSGGVTSASSGSVAQNSAVRVAPTIILALLFALI